jgi:putative membrane protein
VLNALMLLLTSGLASRFGIDFHVSGFGAAFWGAIVVSMVSFLLSIFIRDDRREEER